MAEFVLATPWEQFKFSLLVKTRLNFLIDQKPHFYDPAKDLFVKPRLSARPEKISRRKVLSLNDLRCSLVFVQAAYLRWNCA